MRDLRCSRVEFDESGPSSKRRSGTSRPQTQTPSETSSSTSPWIHREGHHLLVVGKRSMRNTIDLATDVRRRVLGNPEISTDGYAPYVRAVDEAFDGRASHVIVDKQRSSSLRAGCRALLRQTGLGEGGADTDKRCAHHDLHQLHRTAEPYPAHVAAAATRLSNGFSKKFENHCAALALYAAHYNFCRLHEALRITPAMHLGVTDRVWSVGDLFTP